MKTWTIPVAVAQQFIANEYVSACYYIKCCTPNNNSRSSLLVYDNNGNGEYDEGIDEISYKGWVSGCAGIHLARIEGTIANNGIAIRENASNPYVKPVFLWSGEVKDISNPYDGKVIYGDHVTDLTAEGAYSIDNETNFS